MQETQEIRSLAGSGRPPGVGNGTHSSVPALEIPWTEEAGRLHSMRSQKGRTRLSNWTDTYWILTKFWNLCKHLIYVFNCVRSKCVHSILQLPFSPIQAYTLASEIKWFTKSLVHLEFPGRRIDLTSLWPLSWIFTEVFLQPSAEVPGGGVWVWLSV